MPNPRQPSHPIDPLFVQRWSPRAFNGEALSQAQVFSLLEAARWAPSRYNSQPWHFVYSLPGTASWGAIFDSLVPSNQSWAKNAGALIVITSAKKAAIPGKEGLSPNAWHSFDSGAAWVSLALQATRDGLAAHAIAGFDADKLSQSIGIPDSHAIEVVVVVGKQGDKSALPEALQAREIPNERKPLNEIVSEGRF